MNRLIAAVILALTFLIPLSAVSPWTAIATQIHPSIFYLESVGQGGSRTGSCTGFTINTEKSYLLTAAHCGDVQIRIDGTPSIIMFKDERKDLMVLRALERELGPAIQMAKDDPKLGDQVASYGYGFGLEKPMFRIAHVSQVNAPIEELSGPFFMIDSQYIGGQSGGPVVNERGELVSIVQRSTNGLGIGVGVETIRDRVGRYFQSTQ